MDRLNYHHLLYFWAVAREGSVASACRLLHLAQPTVSGQVRALEASLGQKLFQRSGRGLALTETGRTVFRYADDIFSLGTEMVDAVRGRVADQQVKLRIGVADVLPKLLVYRLLLPVLSLPIQPRIACFEGKLHDLVERLAVHDLDVVLGDVPVPPQPGASGPGGARVYSHRLGESGLAVFAAPALAARHRRGFPASLDGAPFLLPTANTALRRTLNHWFESQGIRPAIRGEFEDSALLKVFGQSGAGLFIAPNIIQTEICRQYDVRLVGRLTGLKEQYFAISMERRIKHPAVVALTDGARRRLVSVA